MSRFDEFATICAQKTLKGKNPKITFSSLFRSSSQKWALDTHRSSFYLKIRFGTTIYELKQFWNRDVLVLINKFVQCLGHEWPNRPMKIFQLLGIFFKIYRTWGDTKLMVCGCTLCGLYLKAANKKCNQFHSNIWALLQFLKLCYGYLKSIMLSYCSSGFPVFPTCDSFLGFFDVPLSGFTGFSLFYFWFNVMFFTNYEIDGHLFNVSRNVSCIVRPQRLPRPER